jgi:hypothetical protein
MESRDDLTSLSRLANNEAGIILTRQISVSRMAILVACLIAIVALFCGFELLFAERRRDVFHCPECRILRCETRFDSMVWSELFEENVCSEWFKQRFPTHTHTKWVRGREAVVWQAVSSEKTFILHGCKNPLLQLPPSEQLDAYRSCLNNHHVIDLAEQFQHIGQMAESEGCDRAAKLLEQVLSKLRK